MQHRPVQHQVHECRQQQHACRERRRRLAITRSRAASSHPIVVVVAAAAAAAAAVVVVAAAAAAVAVVTPGGAELATAAPRRAAARLIGCGLTERSGVLEAQQQVRRAERGEEHGGCVLGTPCDARRPRDDACRRQWRDVEQ